MLADRFQELLEARAEAAAQTQAERQARDVFIQAAFASLDADFVALLGEVTGVHARLAVVTTAVIDTINTRTFASLPKTVSEVRSTLYGPLERVVFTPGLEFKGVDQFGVVRVETEGLEPNFGNGSEAPLLRSLLDRGVLMRGRDEAVLAVEKEGGFEPLGAELLEELLARLFIRTE